MNQPKSVDGSVKSLETALQAAAGYGADAVLVVPCRVGGKGLPQPWEFDIKFDRGISWEGTLIDMGVEHGIVQKSGAWFSAGEVRLGQGREQATKFLVENAEVRSKIEAAVREKVGLGG